MNDQQRALWDSILLGHAPSDDLEVELLLSEASDDDMRWIVRGFEPGADELLARWQAYNEANLSTKPVTDDALLERARSWALEVARSARAWELEPLVTQCTREPSLGERPNRAEQVDYLDWLARVNDQIASAPDQQVGAAELRDAFWGATNFHEFVWYLAAPISELTVDPTACVELLGDGGLCWITTSGPVVSRFR